MFDTHCHLNLDVFENNLNEVVAESRNSGVNFITIPGIDTETSKKAFDIANNYTNIYSSAGIHPTNEFDLNRLDYYETVLENLILKSDKMVAVGETGLDYYHFKKSSNEQRVLFKLHIKLASRNAKSLIVHSRHATSDTLKVLDKNWSEVLAGSTVFHCCEPQAELLDFAIKHNIYIGIDGDITYDKQKEIFLKSIPLKLLVLETDSPFLTPDPVRKKTKFPNKPENLKLIAQKASRVLNSDISKVVEQTTRNAKQLFGLE